MISLAISITRTAYVGFLFAGNRMADPYLLDRNNDNFPAAISSFGCSGVVRVVSE
jgi:hypothetical protein